MGFVLDFREQTAADQQRILRLAVRRIFRYHDREIRKGLEAALWMNAQKCLIRN
jgi:hypothetical protein